MRPRQEQSWLCVVYLLLPICATDHNTILNKYGLVHSFQRPYLPALCCADAGGEYPTPTYLNLKET